MASEELKLDRRTLLQLIPATLLAQGALAQAQHCGASAPVAFSPPPYTFQFFTEAERVLLDRVMEKIIPADEHSAGAHEARVVEFADLMVATSPQYVKDDWRNGLTLLASELERSSLDHWLESAAQHEDDPREVLDLFFTKIKQMTVNGYYTSSIGIHQELRYVGNTYLTSFPGCEHPEHKS